MKNTATAYLWWFLGFFGFLGFHRFYLRKYGTGVMWLLTGGVLGIGAALDFLTLGWRVEQFNTEHFAENTVPATADNDGKIR